MNKISKHIAKFIDYVKLGYVATVSSNNTPNLSPKGTIFALNQTHLVFANIRSPQTIKNLQKNSSIEVNVVDPISRKGYRFKGSATILTTGAEFSKILNIFKQRGVKSKILSIVKIRVSCIEQVTSPLYDLGFTESQIRKNWLDYFLEKN